MADASNGARRYEVICSGANAEALRQLQRRASRTGRGKAVSSAFRQIVQGLQRDAERIGEELYRLRAIRVQVRTVVVQPVAVDFAVWEDRPLVFIKSVHLLSG